MIVEPHRHAGIFISRGKEDALVTKNLVPGDSVYGEKRISVEVRQTAHMLCATSTLLSGRIPSHSSESQDGFQPMLHISCRVR